MSSDLYHKTLTTAKVTTNFSPLRIRFESQGRTHGICGAQSVSRTGFFLVLEFPLLIYIPIYLCADNSIDYIRGDHKAACEPHVSRADCS
jgi:hypothetical protein